MRVVESYYCLSCLGFCILSQIVTMHLVVCFNYKCCRLLNSDARLTVFPLVYYSDILNIIFIVSFWLLGWAT